MKVKRTICPSCKAEKRIVTDGSMHEYSEEIVSEVCGRKKCQHWYNSPEQRLLRVIFGERR